MNLGRRTSTLLLATPAPHVRRDVQGLRAVAVGLVVLDHLLGWPRAGFLGVDVFFVISGFLITGLLDRELLERGRVDFVGFYRRRFKRLAPASVFTIVTVLVIAAVLFNPARAASTAEDGIWAALLSANWRMVELGTNYLLATDVVSPLQHFWSLSVEEQFYLAWPLLLSAAYLLPVSAARRRGIAIALVTTVLVASFAWALVDTRVLEARAYFSTFSRAWELAAGGVLHFAAPLSSRLPRAVLRALGWTGIAGLGVSVRVVTDASMPAPGALLPVLCAAAVIAAGSGARDDLVVPLVSRPLVWIGGLSFSIYLWHFPVIVLLAEVLQKGSLRFTVVAAAMIAVLSIACHSLIERPLRRTAWRISPGLRAPRPRTAVFAFAACGLIVALSAVSLSLRVPAEANAVDLSTRIDLSASASPQLAARERAVLAAAGSTSWPTTLQDVQTLADDRAPEWLRDGCLGEDINSTADSVANAERCTYGDARSARRVMVIGDSRAISFVPGVRRALPGWRIEVWTVAQCPFVDVSVTRGDGSVDPDCPKFRKAALDRARLERPDLIVLSNQPALSAVTDLPEGTTPAAAWEAGTRRTVAAVSKAARRVVVLDPAPEMTTIQSCWTPLRTPKDCESTVAEPYLEMVSAQQHAVRTLDRPNVTYPSTLRWFCATDGVCPVFVGDAVTLADGKHLSRRAAVSLGPVLRQTFLHP